MMMLMMMMILHILVRRWAIGTDPVTDAGGWVSTKDPVEDLWPNNIISWRYISEGKWQSDPLLTVTGNLQINILSLNNYFINCRGTTTRLS